MRDRISTVGQGGSESPAAERPSVRTPASLIASVKASVLAALDSRLGTYPERERAWDAGDESTAPDRLATLAADSAPAVRAAVAWNDRAGPEILAALSADPDQRVRKAAAANARLPAHAAETLAQDESARVRGTVAFHPNLPGPALDALASDSDWLVKKAATSIRASRFAAAGEDDGSDETALPNG